MSNSGNSHPGQSQNCPLCCLNQLYVFGHEEKLTLSAQCYWWSWSIKQNNVKVISVLSLVFVTYFYYWFYPMMDAELSQIKCCLFFISCVYYLYSGCKYSEMNVKHHKLILWMFQKEHDFLHFQIFIHMWMPTFTTFKIFTVTQIYWSLLSC